MTGLRAGSLLDRLLQPVPLLVLAALLRILLIVLLGNRTFWADTQEYEATALQFLGGHGPGSTTPRAPLYPIVMALGFKLGGVGNFLAVRALQLVLALLIVHLGGALARRIAGPLAQRITMFVLAVSPTIVFTSGMLYPTVLYSVLLLGVTITAWDLAERPSMSRGVLLGLLVTLGWLTDQVMIAPVAALFVWLAWQVSRRGLSLLRAGMVALVVFIGLATPYMRWQRQAYGGEAVFMQKAQYVLYWSRSDSLMSSTREVKVPPGSQYRPLSPRAFVHQEWSLLQRQPGAYLHDVAFEFFHFFAPMPDRVQTKNQFNQVSILWVGALYFAPVLLLAIVGALAGRGARRDRALLVTVVLATASFYALFFTQTRYRIPVEPQLCILATLGWLRLFPGGASREASAATVPARTP